MFCKGHNAVCLSSRLFVIWFGFKNPAKFVVLELQTDMKNRKFRLKTSERNLKIIVNTRSNCIYWIKICEFCTVYERLCDLLFKPSKGWVEQHFARCQIRKRKN